MHLRYFEKYCYYIKQPLHDRFAEAGVTVQIYLGSGRIAQSLAIKSNERQTIKPLPISGDQRDGNNVTRQITQLCFKK